MTHIRSINLADIPPRNGIEFIEAQWWDENSPLVVILYSHHGEVARLRMDIDKRMFIDHVSDPSNDKTVQSFALPIWEIVSKERILI